MKFILYVLITTVFIAGCSGLTKNTVGNQKQSVGECDYQELSEIVYSYHGDIYPDLKELLLKSNAITFKGRKNLNVLGVNLELRHYELTLNFCFKYKVLDSLFLNENGLVKFNIYVQDKLKDDFRDSLYNSIYIENKKLLADCDKYNNDSIWKTGMVSSGIMNTSNNEYWFKYDDTSGVKIIKNRKYVFIFEPMDSFPQKRYLYSQYYGIYARNSNKKGIAFVNGNDTFNVALHNLNHPRDVVNKYERGVPPQK